MNDHDFDDTAGVGAQLLQLTDARPEPPDPAAPVRIRINRRKRRRAGLAFAGVATATTLAVVTGSTIAGALSGSRDSGVAGFGMPSTAASSPTPGSTTAPGVSNGPTPGSTKQPGADHTKVLPAPWSAKPFTKMPDANAYPPKAYYIAQGQIPTEHWAVLAFSTDACLVTDEGKPNSFGRPLQCYPKATKTSFQVVQSYAKEKDSPKTIHTLVMGVAPINARKVRITARGGLSILTDAVATPSTDKLRYFGVVIPQRDLRGVAITPLDAGGNVIAVPAS